MSGSADQVKLKATMDVSDVAAGSKTIKKGLEEAAGGGDKLAGAARRVGSEIKSFVGEGLRAVGVFQAISLAKAVEEAKRLDSLTARLGQSSGVSGDRLKAQFEGMERPFLTSAPAIAEVSRNLGRATYDANSSADALRGLSTEALSTGRELSEQLDIGKTLHNGLGVIGDTTRELGRLREIAEDVGTVGGRIALQDTLAALSPQLAQVATGSDEARARLEALVAVMGKGLRPEMAQSVAGGALSMIKSRALDIERYTGRRVLDDNGQVIDPTRDLADIKRLGQRKFGTGKRGQELQRRALINEFGADLGLAIWRTDLSEVDRVAKTGTRNAGTGARKTEGEAQAFRASTEGGRLAVQLEKDSAMRGVGDKLNSVQDKLVGTFGATTVAVAELGLGLRGLTSLFGSFGGAAAATTTGTAAMGGQAVAATGSLKALIATVGGSAGLVATSAVAATALLQLKAAADLGEDRDKMGARWRSEREDLISDELRLKQGDRQEDVDFDAAMRRGKKSLEGGSWLDSAFGWVEELGGKKPGSDVGRAPAMREVTSEVDLNEDFEVVTIVKPKRSGGSSKGGN